MKTSKAQNVAHKEVAVPLIFTKEECKIITNAYYRMGETDTIILLLAMLNNKISFLDCRNIVQFMINNSGE